MTYEQARFELKHLQDMMEYYRIEMQQRKQYLLNVCKLQHATQDTKYLLMHMLSMDVGRQISTLKQFLSEFPDYNSQPAMWKNLTRPQRYALKLIRDQIGEQEFIKACKEGFRAVRREDQAMKTKQRYQQLVSIERQKEMKAYDWMMRQNNNPNL